MNDVKFDKSAFIVDYDAVIERLGNCSRSVPYIRIPELFCVVEIILCPVNKSASVRVAGIAFISSFLPI